MREDSNPRYPCRYAGMKIEYNGADSLLKTTISLKSFPKPYVQLSAHTAFRKPSFYRFLLHWSTIYFCCKYNGRLYLLYLPAFGMGASPPSVHCLQCNPPRWPGVVNEPHHIALLCNLSKLNSCKLWQKLDFVYNVHFVIWVA